MKNTDSKLDPALKSLVVRADEALARSLPPEDTAPFELHRAMRYAVLGGGKRLRPLLVYAAGHAFGESGSRLDAPACAVELIHAYSLVHDDLPAMDDDSLRRGRPTCHIVFGEAMAILAGDALQALAFELLAHDVELGVAPTRCVEMLRVLGRACGAEGMAGGQALDLAAVGRKLSLAELEHMHACKTGALIRASVRLGALDIGRASALKVSPTADSVLIANHRNELLHVDLAEGTLRVVDRSEHRGIGGFDWSPDGNWAAYGFATSTVR